MAQTLKFGNKVWAAKEDSVLAYNDINNNYKPLPFDFARASIGTRVNKDGLIETMGQDIARIDYTDSADGVLLLEPSRTNSLLQSNQFDTSWSISSGVTITSEQAISPDGSNNGWKFEKTATSYKSIGQSYTSSSETTFSIFAKKGTLSVITLFATISGGSNLYQRFDLKNGTISSGLGMSNSNIEDFGNGWYRCSSTFTNANVTSLDFFVEFAETNEGYIYIYGAQAEPNSSYATSYIPTSGSTVTRAAETCNNSGNSEVFNDSEGVLFANIAALDNDGTYRMISLSDGTVNNSTNIQFSGVSNQIRTRVENGGIPQATISSNVTSQTLFHKIAVLYKSNKFELWANGFKLGEDTSGTPPSGINKLSFDRGDGLSDFYGKTKELGYYDAILTDAELETLTSYRNWVSMVNELNLNIIYNG